jgi:hypothetical protein
MPLVFQVPSNVLTYLPLQPFASWRISCCYSVSQHLSLSPVSSSVSVSATTEFVITAMAETVGSPFYELLVLFYMLFYMFMLHYVNVPMYQCINYVYYDIICAV